jgi:L-iditol 2-dehydrogenase
MECDQCRQQKYEMCRHYNYLGSRTDGGFAEYVRVPEWNLIRLPDLVTFEQAAMMEPMAVAVHAIRKVLNESTFSNNNEVSVAVCGLGTIGLCMVMFLKYMGFSNVYAIGNKSFQKRTLSELGIDENHYIDSSMMTDDDGRVTDEWRDRFDIFFEAVGKNDTLNLGIQTVKPGGYIRLTGNPVSDMTLPRDIYWKILRGQITISGTWNSSFTHSETDDWHLVLSALENGGLSPERLITHRYPLDRLEAGLLMMRDKTEDYIKVMVIVNCSI